MVAKIVGEPSKWRRGVGRAFQSWSRSGSRRLPPSESSFLCPAIESPRLERVTDIGLHASASEGSLDGDRQLFVQRHILLCIRCARDSPNHSPPQASGRESLRRFSHTIRRHSTSTVIIHATKPRCRRLYNYSMATPQSAFIYQGRHLILCRVGILCSLGSDIPTGCILSPIAASRLHGATV